MPTPGHLGQTPGYGRLVTTYAERPATPWDVRDLPLLRAAARRLDTSARTWDADQLADEAGLSEDDAKLAGKALIERGFLMGEYHKAPASFDLAMVYFTGVTEKGARAAGLWPSEDGLEALMAALAEVEARTDDPVKAGKVRRVLEAVGGLGRDLGVEVGASIITKMAGM